MVTQPARIKNRADFLACAASGHKWVRPAFVIQLRLRKTEEAASSALPRLGFTTTKKLGNAVVRNRIRRRLREAARLYLAPSLRDHHDYVIIGRPEAATLPLPQLGEEMATGVRKLHHLIDKPRFAKTSQDE